MITLSFKAQPLQGSGDSILLPKRENKILLQATYCAPSATLHASTISASISTGVLKKAEIQPSGKPNHSLRLSPPANHARKPPAPCHLQVRPSDAGEGSLARAQTPLHEGPLERGGGFFLLCPGGTAGSEHAQSSPGLPPPRTRAPRSRRRTQTCQRQAGTAESRSDAGRAPEPLCGEGSAREGADPEPPTPEGSEGRETETLPRQARPGPDDPHPPAGLLSGAAARCGPSALARPPGSPPSAAPSSKRLESSRRA